MLVPSQVEQYQRDGFFIARGLFPPEEVTRLRTHFMRLREGHVHPGDFVGVPIQQIWGDSAKTGDLLFEDKPDPLKNYPRMIHMHRWDENQPELAARQTSQGASHRVVGSRTLCRPDNAVFQTARCAWSGTPSGSVLSKGAAGNVDGGLDGARRLR